MKNMYKHRYLTKKINKESKRKKPALGIPTNLLVIKTIFGGDSVVDPYMRCIPNLYRQSRKMSYTMI